MEHPLPRTELMQGTSHPPSLTLAGQPPPSSSSSSSSASLASSASSSSSSSVSTSLSSPQPLLSASNAVREDQVNNAVRFLSHPSVRSADLIKKQEFLLQKGLTHPEVMEAFRRANLTANRIVAGSPDHVTPQPYAAAAAAASPPVGYYGPYTLPYATYHPLPQTPTSSWSIGRSWLMPFVVSLSCIGLASQLWSRYLEWRRSRKRLQAEQPQQEARRSIANDLSIVSYERVASEASEELRTLKKEVVAALQDQSAQLQAISDALAVLLRGIKEQGSPQLVSDVHLSNTKEDSETGSDSSRRERRAEELQLKVKKMVRECRLRNAHDEDIRKPLGTLMLILKNLVQYPYDEKYRKVNALTPSIKERFGDSANAAFQFMKDLGFKQDGQIYSFAASDLVPVELGLAALEAAYNDLLSEAPTSAVSC